MHSSPLTRRGRLGERLALGGEAGGPLPRELLGLVGPLSDAGAGGAAGAPAGARHAQSSRRGPWLSLGPAGFCRIGLVSVGADRRLTEARAQVGALRAGECADVDKCLGPNGDACATGW